MLEQTSLASMAQEPATDEVKSSQSEQQNSEAVGNEAEADSNVADADAAKDDSSEGESKGESKGDTDTDTSEESDSVEDEESSKPKPKRGFEKRIAKEIARKTEALREMEYWKKVALGQNPNATDVQTQTQPQAVQQSQVKPKFSDYNDLEEYTEAVADWKMEQKIAEREARNAEQARANTYDSRVKELEAIRPDFQEVLADSDLVISKAATDLIMESDIGPAIVLYLAENEDLTESLNKMGPVRQLAELGKLEARLAKEYEGKLGLSGSGKSSTATKTVVAKKVVSKAPAPVKPLSGGAPVTTKSLDDPNLSPEEWIKMRNKVTGYR